MFAPTETIFSCVMKAVLARLSLVHDEDAWCQYFQRQHLSHPHPLNLGFGGGQKIVTYNKWGGVGNCKLQFLLALKN